MKGSGMPMSIIVGGVQKQEKLSKECWTQLKDDIAEIEGFEGANTIVSYALFTFSKNSLYTKSGFTPFGRMNITSYQWEEELVKNAQAMAHRG